MAWSCAEELATISGVASANGRSEARAARRPLPRPGRRRLTPLP
jgi:hypothetical protein